MNGDGEVTVTDIMLIARLIMYPTMNAPRHAPAMVANGDRMSGEDIALTTGETRTVSINLDNSLDYTGFQLDMQLPAGLTASNFALTNRDANHVLSVNTLSNGAIRVLCYSPQLDILEGNSGGVLTFNVSATGNVKGNIAVNGIELVTSACKTVILNEFGMAVNASSAVNDLYSDKSISVYASGRDIIVESPDKQMVCISDVTGRMRRVEVNAGRTVISGNDSGIYIVIADGKTSKLLLK